MSGQTHVRLSEVRWRPGMVDDGFLPLDTIGRTLSASGTATANRVRAGDLGVRPAGAPDFFDPLAAPAAADTDAIIETIGSTAGEQTLDGDDLDGVIGGGLIFPPRNLVFTHNGHSDWDATTGIVRGLDEYGREQTESFSIPNGTGGGAQAVTLTKIFSRVISLFIPTQTGTSGTADLGTGTKLGPLTERFALGVVRYLAAKEKPRNLSPDAEYLELEHLALVKKGRIWVPVEEAVTDGQQAYVRLVATSEERVGSWRHDRDGTEAAPDAVPVIGARFASNSELDADGDLGALLQLDL